MKAFLYCVLAALLGAAIAQVQGDDAPRRNSTTSEYGVEVLTRVPAQEVLAEMITFHPGPNIAVARVAPKAIEELPSVHSFKEN
jgi:hypothetical protein